nr:hypothetical protein [Tanacetum cinerariifolium]
MGDENLDTIPATKSDEVIKSSVEDLVPIPSEFKGIPDTMCDVHLVNNPTPLEAKDHFEIVINSNDDYSSSDDDSLYYENIDSGSTTTHSDISLSEYKAFFFYDDHIKEISSSSTTTQSDISLLEYDSFIFDLSNGQFPSTDRSDFTHEEFGDEPAHIISPPEYDCFYFGNLLDPSELISSLNSGIHENLSSTTCVNLPIKDDYSPLLAYVVWNFLAYLTYHVIPPRLHSFGNEDTIFDPGITINRSYSFKPGLSHRCDTFKKFNTHQYVEASPHDSEFVSLEVEKIVLLKDEEIEDDNLLEDDYFPLLAYVVWIFLAYLTYPVIPPHLHLFENEDTIFDPGITINRSYSFKPGLSHRCGAFKKFNTHRSHLNESPMEMLISTLFPMDQ